MKQTLLALPLLLALAAGCGGSDYEPEAKSAPTKSVVTEEPVAETALAELCPKVEAAIVANGDSPEADDWALLWSDLTAMERTGDQEAKNAFSILIPAVRTFVDDPASGQEFLDARADYRAALGTFADRCKAVGSSALQ